jgi:four helix bundle protein
MLRGHRDLKVFQLAYRLAMEIFHLTKHFPREEVYSLTDQIRRSSRSVAANLAEAFRKRRYPNMLDNKLTDCDGEATETQVWLDFSLDCGYMRQEDYDRLTQGYEEVGKMLFGMMANPKRFAPSESATTSS